MKNKFDAQYGITPLASRARDQQQPDNGGDDPSQQARGMMDGVIFRHDCKFDIQLSQAIINERRLAEVFATGRIEKIELKSETWQWEQTGNICVEYRCDGKPSGIATTEADFWVHELRRDDATLVYLMFPIERLKELARRAIKAGRSRRGGDGGRFDVVLLPLSSILRP